jgi:ATP-dependent 26S proteasome regulatory subunit
MDGGGDPERQQALEQYKNKLLESREWESKLKALRMDIKGLQGDFETTEDNIKALQSVGQIIGEVLKQLDEERCKPSPAFLLCTVAKAFSPSHRQSLVRPSICCRMPLKGRQSKAETRDSRCTRYDHPHDNANASARS